LDTRHRTDINKTKTKTHKPKKKGLTTRTHLTLSSHVKVVSVIEERKHLCGSENINRHLKNW